MFKCENDFKLYIFIGVLIKFLLKKNNIFLSINLKRTTFRRLIESSLNNLTTLTTPRPISKVGMQSLGSPIENVCLYVVFRPLEYVFLYIVRPIFRPLLGTNEHSLISFTYCDLRFLRSCLRTMFGRTIVYSCYIVLSLTQLGFEHLTHMRGDCSEFTRVYQGVRRLVL